jgi:hypothetical protein
MLKSAVQVMFLACAVAGVVKAQEAQSSFSVPVNLSAGAMYTQRLQLSDPNNSAEAVGFRAMIYPQVKLGSHWFGYAAVQVDSNPYFYYDAFSPEWKVETDVIQAFMGYSYKRGNFSIIAKAGRLSSAFGSFPLRYDDTDNPLLDQPLSYITEVPLRSDQLLCGVSDLLAQHYGSVNASCGGAPGAGPGLQPVSLYGLPGVEADISAGPVDARLQLSSGSPANPQPVVNAGQYAQWTAGAGYTIRQALRVGFSAFRGPYLDQGLALLLPAGTTVRNFPASGFGADAQWNHGHWSTTGEWQTFRFDSPNFVVAPSIASGYGEVKRVLTPRFYVAGRAGYLNSGRVVDRYGVSAASFASDLQSYEFGAGAWLNHFELLKASYSWLRIPGLPGTRTNVLGIQFVTSIRSLGWPLN